MKNLHKLDCSALLEDVRARQGCPFEAKLYIAGRVINWLYCFVDDVYTPYHNFLNTLQAPTTNQKRIVRKALKIF